MFTLPMMFGVNAGGGLGAGNGLAPAVRKRAIVLAAIFFVVGLAGVLRHEMWRDEMQPWLIGKDTASLGQLWNVSLHQKHPVLWYASLYGLSRLWPNPVAMQVLHLAIATFSAFLLFAYSPFRMAHKIFLGFGYYFLYEYAVISRSYALGILFLFAFLATYPRFRQSPFPAAACLFLLANTSIYGLILASALGCVLLIEVLTSVGLRRLPKFWAGLAVIGLGLALCFFQLKPLPTSIFERATPFHTTFNAGLLVDVLILVPRAFLPFPLPALNFWNHPLLGQVPGARAVEVVLSLVILGGAFALVRRSRTALVFFSLALGGIFLWSYVGYIGFARHYGHLFIAFVAALWIAWAGRPRSDPAAAPRIGFPVSRPLKTGLASVFLVHFLAGLFSAAMDFRHIFSQGKNTARLIRARGWDRLPIVAHILGPCIPVAGYLGRPLFYVSKGEFGTFGSPSPHKTLVVTPGDMLREADRLSRLNKRDCLILLSLSLLERDFHKHNRLIRVGKSPPAIVEGESYYLYLWKYVPQDNGQTGPSESRAPARGL